jgi:GTPase SAR1 family protein
MCTVLLFDRQQRPKHSVTPGTFQESPHCRYNDTHMKDPAIVSRKIAVLGYRAVGKSSLTNSFVTGTFSETYDPTIEGTHHKAIRFRKVHFATDIIDTAGMVRRQQQQHW